MIKQIIIKNTASYNSTDGVSFLPTQINFVYGANGSGKTTMSNVIANCALFPSCKLDWGLSQPLQTLVYNKGFIEANFEQSSELKGIFTLGKESKAEIESIKSNQKEIEEKQNQIQSLRITHQQQIEKLKFVEETFTDQCWQVYKKHESSFIKAFEGFRNSKQKFKEKVIIEANTNSQPILLLSELEEKAEAILNSEAVKAPEIRPFTVPELKDLEENSIFLTRIIGKDDVDLSRMILKLNNSDWVRQGLEFFKVNDGYCPFCQQVTDETFKKDLEAYFDETYNRQIKELKSATDKYNVECETVSNALSSYLSLNNRFVDAELLSNFQSIVTSIYQKNLLTLEKKAKEPTIRIELESINEHLNKIKEIIDVAITKTKEHNKLIANIEQERKRLVSQIWSFIIAEIKRDFDSYQQQKGGIEKAVNSISQKIKALEEEITQLKGFIQDSERKITSVKPTIDAINKTLLSFGFTNFSLAEGSSPGTYKVVRETGIDAKRTLSEGEKTFITFLYFFHLTKGSFETDNITNNKVLVIDDPISSLDSSILFIVSNLVRGLISECKSGSSTIKQIFILTHNVYFHKEVTFRKRDYSSKGESFWILKRVANISTITEYNHNPIQTSYDLLWQEIRNPNEINKLTVFNTLRRILEYYFKILGRIKDDDLLNKFEGEEKIICNALMSWINDGSHVVYEDIFVSSDDETVEKYLKIFKKIFELENQVEHYNMMMKSIHTTPASVVSAS